MCTTSNQPRKPQLRDGDGDNKLEESQQLKESQQVPVCKEPLLPENIRAEELSNHHLDNIMLQVDIVYRPRIDDVESKFCYDDWDDVIRGLYGMWHKSVPIYFPEIESSCFRWVGTGMELYVYTRWLRSDRLDRPHQPDWIGNGAGEGDFICKFIMPIGFRPSTPPSSADITSLLSLHKTLFARAEAADMWNMLKKIIGARLPGPRRRSQPRMRPLFQALLIVASPNEYSVKESDATAVARWPVYLVRTGVENNLRAPISFDSIADRVQRQPHLPGDVMVKTTLETAVDFVLALEAREAAAEQRWFHYGPTDVEGDFGITKELTTGTLLRCRWEKSDGCYRGLRHAEEVTKDDAEESPRDAAEEGTRDDVEEAPGDDSEKGMQSKPHDVSRIKAPLVLRPRS